MSDLSTPSPDPSPSDLSTSAPSNTALSTDSPPTPTQRQFPARIISQALFVACPMLIFAPPRKLDFYTFSLATAWVVSANKLYVMESPELPAWIKRRRPTAAVTSEERADESLQSFDVDTSEARKEEDQRGGVSGLARRLWMGQEQPGWQERRLREERKKLEEGESYAGMIGDAIMEAFGMAKKAEEGAGEDATEENSAEENSGKDG